MILAPLWFHIFSSKFGAESLLLLLLKQNKGTARRVSRSLTARARTPWSLTAGPPPGSWDSMELRSMLLHWARFKRDGSHQSWKKSVAAGTPLGRVGRPADVADVIIFL